MAWNNVIDEIKMRVNIVDEIGKTVDLKKSGSYYKGLCPFHNEKTPSFMVSEDKQTFNCYGCGVYGDVIKFVELYDKIPFVEAVDKLCDENGIKKPEFSGNKNNIDYEKYYNINAMAAKFFYNSLATTGNSGIKYLHSRDIKNETIQKWGLGYAPADGKSLTEHLYGQGVEDEDMIKLGLAARNNSGRLYDKFRDRVIFPIFNTRGKVIGFGGRVIGNTMPKYLNSPESEIFLKKNNLFGLNFTKNDISKSDQVIMVEGYIDVISLWQNGVKNVAASLGTALTDNQARLITRYTKNVVLSYDSDDAGVKASFRGIDIMSNADARVKVLSIPEGKDPDDYVKKNGKSAFESLINNAISGTEYKLNVLKRGYDFNDKMQVVDYIDKIAPLLRKLSPVEQEIFIKKIASEFNISETSIELSLHSESDNIKKTTNIKNKKIVSDDNINLKLEFLFLVLIFRNPKYYSKMKGDNIKFKSSIALKIESAIAQSIEKYGLENSRIDENEIIKVLEPDEEIKFFSIVQSYKIGTDDETFYKEIKNAYLTNEYRIERVQLLNDLSVAEKLEDSEEMHRIAKKIINIDADIEKIKEA